MTSTQEPNTIAPRSKDFFFASLESELSFDSKDSKSELRSSTFDNCEITAWSPRLEALRALYNISSDVGEDLFADELLVY